MKVWLKKSCGDRGAVEGACELCCSCTCALPLCLPTPDSDVGVSKRCGLGDADLALRRRNGSSDGLLRQPPIGSRPADGSRRDNGEALRSRLPLLCPYAPSSSSSCSRERDLPGALLWLLASLLLGGGSADLARRAAAATRAPAPTGYHCGPADRTACAKEEGGAPANSGLGGRLEDCGSGASFGVNLPALPSSPLHRAGGVEYVGSKRSREGCFLIPSGDSTHA
mmetsp:Transcript_17062/g.30791  ORF Transcript_17062/g.30791 Transcript_17062/m.30791 type:complete len:225 (+) Transcript_17062:415-1089(+)